VLCSPSPACASRRRLVDVAPSSTCPTLQPRLCLVAFGTNGWSVAASTPPLLPSPLAAIPLSPPSPPSPPFTTPMRAAAAPSPMSATATPPSMPLMMPLLLIGSMASRQQHSCGGCPSLFALRSALRSPLRSPLSPLRSPLCSPLCSSLAPPHHPPHSYAPNHCVSTSIALLVVDAHHCENLTRYS